MSTPRPEHRLASEPRDRVSTARGKGGWDGTQEADGRRGREGASGGEKRSHSCRRSQGEMGTSSTSFWGQSKEQVSGGWQGARVRAGRRIREEAGAARTRGGWF